MATKKMTTSLLLVFALLTGHAQTNLSEPRLSIGDPAPQLEVSKWLKGTPVARFEKGKVYVVEFWATWCVPCIKAMPHLSSLARQYRDSVTVVGVSVWESKKKPMPDVAAIQRFVDEKGEDMDYIVAMDDPAKNTVSGTWLRAADIRGIPATFVIDRDGKITWIGHPMQLDAILKQVVESPEPFDVEAVKAVYEKNREQKAKQRAVRLDSLRRSQ